MGRKIYHYFVIAAVTKQMGQIVIHLLSIDHKYSNICMVKYFQHQLDNDSAMTGVINVRNFEHWLRAHRWHALSCECNINTVHRCSMYIMVHPVLLNTFNCLKHKYMLCLAYEEYSKFQTRFGIPVPRTPSDIE